MKLIRTATLYFKPGLSVSKAWRASTMGVEVETLGIWKLEDRSRQLVAATIGLPAPLTVTSAGTIQIPTVERETAEWAIGIMADVLAVQGGAERSISSPIPWVALVPENEQERTLLASTAGLDTQPLTIPSVAPGAPLELVLKLVPERPNGLALLAEALSHEHPTGRFNELIRFLELAFRMNAKHLPIPLSEFLASGTLGYSRPEVDGWIQLRNRAVHANRPPGPVLGSAIRPVLDRMEQAAYDVLFNKAEWHNRSSARRQLWTPTAITPAPGTDLRVQVGSRDALQVQFLDAFGTFRLDLSAGIVDVPSEWWIGAKDLRTLSGRVMKANVEPRSDRAPREGE